MSLAGKKTKAVYSSLLNANVDSVSGISDNNLHTVQDGIGTSSSLHIATGKVNVKPSSNNSGTLTVQNSSGTNILSVNTTDQEVLVNSGQYVANTQFKEFGIYEISPTQGHHNAMISQPGFTAVSGSSYAVVSTGNSDNPDTSLTVVGAGEFITPIYWYIPCNLTLDSVNYLAQCDASSTVNLHLMQYDVVSGSSATAGDLSNGTVLACNGSAADNLTPITVGDDRVSIGNLTILSSTISSGKIVLATIENIGGTDDITGQINLQYHIK